MFFHIRSDERLKLIVKNNKNHSMQIMYKIALLLLEIIHFEELPLTDKAFEMGPLFFMSHGVCSARLTSMIK